MSNEESAGACAGPGDSRPPPLLSLSDKRSLITFLWCPFPPGFFPPPLFSSFVCLLSSPLLWLFPSVSSLPPPLFIGPLSLPPYLSPDSFDSKDEWQSCKRVWWQSHARAACVSVYSRCVCFLCVWGCLCECVGVCFLCVVSSLVSDLLSLFFVFVQKGRREVGEQAKK